MGLFSFSQGLLNKSQRSRLQRARSHRCHRQPPDSACAHGDPPRAPPRRNGQPTDSTCTQSASLAPPQDRLKTTSEAQKQIFGVLQLFCDCGLSRGAKSRIAAQKHSKSASKRLISALQRSKRIRNRKKVAKSPIFCFYEAILRDKTNFQRPDHHNEAASQRTDCLSQKIPQRQIATTASNSAKGGSPQPQANPVCFNDVHSGDCSPRAVLWEQLSAPCCSIMPRTDTRCSRR